MSLSCSRLPTHDPSTAYVPYDRISTSSSGIGLAASKTFASAGMHVVMADINSSLLKSSVEEVKRSANGHAGDVTGVEVDVSKVEDVVRLRDTVLDQHGEIAVLMNNVGSAATSVRNRDSANWDVLGCPAHTSSNSFLAYKTPR